MSDSFIDTNIVIYTLSQNEDKQNIAIALLAQNPATSVQVLSETANVLEFLPRIFEKPPTKLQKFFG